MSYTLMAGERLLQGYAPAAARPLPVTHPIVLVRPPYEVEDVRPAGPDLARVADMPGAVVGVQLTRSAIEVEPVRALLQDISQRAPSCPVVVLLDMPPEDSLGTIARLASLRVRAVVPLAPSLPSILREVLTDPAALPGGVIDWLQDRSIRLNPNQADLLLRVLTEAPAHASVGDLLEANGLSSSSARFRMRKRRLPAPGRWFQLARALHVALLLQRHPDLPLARAAERLGFADHSALAHLLRRSCGVGSKEIRGTLGWEWLLHRWLTSRGVRRK